MNTNKEPICRNRGYFRRHYLWRYKYNPWNMGIAYIPPGAALSHE